MSKNKEVKKKSLEVVMAPEIEPSEKSPPTVFQELELAMAQREPGYDQNGSALLPDQDPVLIINDVQRSLTKVSRPDLHYRGHYRPQEGYCEDKFRPVEEWWKYEHVNLTIYMTKGSVIKVKQLRASTVRPSDKCTMIVDQSYIRAETLSVGADAHVQASKLVTEGFLRLGLVRIYTTSLIAKHQVSLNNLESYESNIHVESCDLHNSTMNNARIFARHASVSTKNSSVSYTTLSLSNAKHIIIGTEVQKFDFNNYNFDGTILLSHRTHYGSFGTVEASFVNTMTGMLFGSFEIKRHEWLGSESLADDDHQSSIVPWNAFQPLPTPKHVATNTAVFWKLLAVTTGNAALGYKQNNNRTVKPNQLQRSLVDQISTQITSRMELWQTIDTLKEPAFSPDIGDFQGDYYCG